MTDKSDRRGRAEPLSLVIQSRLEGLVEPAVLVSLDYRILAVNRAYKRKYPKDIELGKDRCHWVSHRFRTPCDENGETCPLRTCRETSGSSRVLHVHFSPTGPEHVDVMMEPILDSSGAIVAFLEILRTVHSMGRGEAQLIGRSRSFTRAIGSVQRVADSDVAVLLEGESGTGKELFAQALHQESDRRDGPFIPVECSGLTESLFESELFGHEAGSFTGARRKKAGLVEAARGGTLFLDEIGDIPIGLQVKLLRLLESRTFRRVGSVDRHHTDFRLICATHTDLLQLVRDGRFRLDLYYRINAFPITVPPLRERRTDIPLLCVRFLATSGKRLSKSALDALQAHSFPGNIRELKNLMRRAVLLCDGQTIFPQHLMLLEQREEPPKPTKVRPLAEVEAEYLRWARENFVGDRAELAEALGLSPRTLYRKLSALDSRSR